VASLMFNGAEQVLAWIGVNKAGGVWAPLNASLIGDDLARTLRDTAARIFIVDAENLPKVVALPHFAIVSAGYRYGETLSATGADRHYTTLPLFHASGVQLGIVGPLPNDMTVVMYRRF